MFKDYFERRKIRRIFGRYLSDQAVEKIMKEGPSDFGQMEPAEIEFVCMLLRDDTAPEEISRQIEIISNLCVDFSADVSNICGPFLFAEFSSKRPVTDATQKRVALAGKIRLELGNNIKVVHGSVTGYEGLFGGNVRWAYCLTFSGFGKALAMLTQLDFGEISEFKP